VPSHENGERSLIPPGDELTQQCVVRQTCEGAGAKDAPKLTKKCRTVGSSH
jgi:hypothetical protein